MFKITIDNEEVITDKDFTIEEEMLNTPSVILNNVYPKEWEQDKDYLGFYHPNEYSKCKIFDEEIIPASEGSTIEGTNFQINYDTSKNFDYYLNGNTSQSGTPTPTAPIPVNTATGRQDIEVYEENLLDNSYELNFGKNLYYIEPQTLNGVSLSYDTDGAIVLNGTSTAGFTAFKSTVSLEGTYTLSVSNSQIQASTYIRTRNASNIIVHNATLNNTNYKTRTMTSSIASLEITIGASGITYDNFKIYVQLEKGSQATSFSPYKTPLELCKIGNYQDFIRKSTGVNLLNIEQLVSGYWYLNGTLTNNPNWSYVNQQIPVQPNTTYTLSRNNTSTTASQFSIEEFDKNGNFVKHNALWQAVGIHNYTITTQPETAYVYCQWNNTYSYNDVMFEEGSQRTIYEPYDSAGQWYMYKVIGKVVLDGTENWGEASSVVSNTKRYYYDNDDVINSGNVSDNKVYTLSNDFVGISWSGIYSTDTTTTNAIANYNSNTGVGRIVIRMSTSVASSLANFKTWLGTNQPNVYYVKQVPTTELIEDTELLEQLEEVNLFEGINNISITSPYLPSTMNLHYNFNDEIITEDLYFCGVVKNSGNISLNPREPHFQTLQILSYKTFLSEGETLDFVIYQKTIREAIEQVVGVISDYGFVVGNINILNPDEVIGAYSTKDKSAYDVFNYIADITQSRWTTRMIDEDTIAIDFYDPSLMILGTTIDYTKEFFSENLIDDMSYSYGTNDYRNKQVMTSQEVYSNITQTQNVIANGYQTQFNVEQPIGKINSIKIDGVNYSFATNTEKEMGVIADFYYSVGNNYFESASSISIGTVIVIDYLPIIEGRQIITNSNEIDRVSNSTGVKGIVARYENRNDATTSTELQLIGQSYIKYKGVPEIVLTIQARKDLWNVGQRVFFNAPINELATEYMVRKKKINRITSINTIFYTFELVSSFNSETAVNYFDNQRAKANGNIGEGEYISRNIDIQSNANIIFYDTQANEITYTGDNTLNATLDAPFIV